MTKTKLRTSKIMQLRLLSLLTVGVVSVVVNAAQPRLVVGIVVEGLQQEYIDLLRDRFGVDGFNRLLNNGLVLENVEFGPGMDATAAAAVVMTGASPSVNGIPSTLVYDATAHRYRSIFDDGKTVGNFTDQTMNPAALRVSTLSDEARIAGAGVTYVYAVAAEPEMAMVLGGHAGNSAIWINDKTGNWSGSTAYTEFPASVATSNRLTPLNTRMDTMQWVPAASLAGYDGLPDHLTRYPFRHTYQRSNPDRMAAFKNSALVNQEVTRVATDLISSLKLGQHDGADVLNLAYNLTPYEFTKTAENRYEIIDSYIKLDSDLANLFRQLDKTVGRDGAIVFLSGTPPTNRRRREEDRWNIPAGEFSTRKAISLFNLYLIALHGNGDWVNAYANNTFYINTDLSNERNVDLSTLRRETADFLKRMAGIDLAFTIDDILNGQAPVDNPEALRRNTVVGTTGDVIIQLVPGWSLVDDFNYPGAKDYKVSVRGATTAPAYILIPQTEPQTVVGTVDARAIAPTVARQMHIRSPNGAAVAPMRVSRK